MHGSGVRHRLNIFDLECSGWSWFLSFLSLHFVSATLTSIVSAQLFTNSDSGYLWFFWVMTFIATINYSLAIGALTSKGTRGVLIGLLVFFAGVILTFVVDYQEADSGIISLVSLHPVAAFSFGVQEIAYLEDRGVGLSANTVESSDYPSGYTFSNAVASLITDIIFWGGLSWYLNRVIPLAYGQALPWYFPFTSSYWCPNSAKPRLEEGVDEASVSGNDIPLEPVPETLRRQAEEGKSIEIRNLRRAFGDKLAVDGLNLSMYSNSITALLGHNGAGKTTTISMLTGALSPTEGYALVAGKDIRTQINQIRQDLGICLQHDCLFPQLTVREHVEFFARIKGIYNKMSREEAEAHIDQAIADVALSEKRHTFSKNLSGGMKRKLSVAIAFCGGSKVVLLYVDWLGLSICTSQNALTFRSFTHKAMSRRQGWTPSPVASLGMLFVNTAKIAASFLLRTCKCHDSRFLFSSREWSSRVTYLGLDMQHGRSRYSWRSHCHHVRRAVAVLRQLVIS